MKSQHSKQILLLGSLSLSLAPGAHAACASDGATPPTYTCTDTTANLTGFAPANNGATVNIAPGAALLSFNFSQPGQTALLGNPDLGTSHVTINAGAGSTLGSAGLDNGIAGDFYNVNVGANATLGGLVLRGDGDGTGASGNLRLSMGSTAIVTPGVGNNVMLVGSNVTMDSDATLRGQVNVAWQPTKGKSPAQYSSLTPARRVLHDASFHFGANTVASDTTPGTRNRIFFQAIPNLNSIYGVDDQQDFGTNLRVQVDNANLTSTVGFNIIGLDNQAASGPALNVDNLTADVSDAGLVVIDTKNSRFSFGKNGGNVNVFQTGTATPALYSGLVTIGGTTNVNFMPSRTYRGTTATPVLDNNIFDINGNWTTQALSDYYVVSALNTEAGNTNTFNFGQYDPASTFTAASGTTVMGGAGDETVNLYGGTMNGGVSLAGGQDTMTIAGGRLNGNVDMGDGDDAFAMTGGMLAGGFSGGAGDDTALFAGVNTSTITGIDGGTGTNTLTFDTIQHTGGHDLTSWNTINLNHNTNLNLNSDLALTGTAGASQTLNIDPTSTLTATGQRSITGSGPLTVTNAGRIDLSGTAPATGDRLVIGGDYVGNNARITMDSMVGATGSPTDRMLVNGNASGTTTLHINNIGGTGAGIGAGTGAANTDGISLVQVAGTAAPGNFALAGGYVAAGPYQYVLRSFAPGASAASERDGQLGGSGSFYDFRLQSPLLGALVPVPQIAAYRAAMPSLTQTGSELLDTMHNRLGEIRHMVGKDRTWSDALFVRAKGSELQFDGDKGPDFRHNNVFIQMGATPLRHIDANGGEWHGGVALAYSDSSIKVPSTESRAQITMPTVSGMLSYLHPSGWYVDSVLQASAIRTKFKTVARGDTGKTSGYGFGASIEGGYNIQLPANLRIEPQAQLQYQYQHLKGFTDVDQIEVGKLGGSSLFGRIGARLMLDRSDEAGRTATPYVEANLIRQLAGSSNVVHAAGVDFAGDKVGTMAQYGLGVNVQWDKNVAMYLQARYTQSLGSRGYSGWGGTVGVRANF